MDTLNESRAHPGAAHVMENRMLLEVSIALPLRYRFDEFVHFHDRDERQLAERVDADARSLHKAILWKRSPALLELHWKAGQVQARLHAVHPEPAESDRDVFQAMVKRMLGLVYAPGALELAHGDHPELGSLLSRQAGLHVPGSPTPFEALTWAITGQQITVAVAVSLRRRLISLAGEPLAQVGAMPGLHAYPDAQRVAALDINALRGAGFSQAKAQTLLAVAQAVAEDRLPLDEWAGRSAAGSWSEEDVAAASAQLLAVKGIGPWTVNYTLLRGYGWPDGSLHGDVAVRRAIGLLTGSAQPDACAARDWLDQFKPWRALVAAHLWASLSDSAY
ncbi:MULTISPECIES: DNA-3-methyladenine glycosylase 2 [Comamonas]|uniref:DNA-3-methyladenine glycosylase 2 n=1 Tax=Comamonas TaxID=283 RepID=UPI0025DAACA8|nr:MULTISPECIES: DNA repair protein [Comamonas]MDR3066183.1 DNA repair protein [Comamonas sp.]MEB5963946.1 DNA repair protein [Comamonas testosteroni]